jgi:hypothetical protein
MKKILTALLAAAIPIAGYAGTYTFTNSSSALENLAHGTAYTWGLSSTSTVSPSSTLGQLETAVKAGHDVTSATLTISNIWDWEANSLDPADVLYVNILNNVSASNSGVNQYTYNSNPSTSDTSFGPDIFETGTANETTTNANLPFTAISPTATANLEDQANSLLVYSGSHTVTSYTNPTTHTTSTNNGTWSDPNGGSNDDFTLTINLSSANLSLINELLDTDNSTTDLGLGFGPDCHYYDSGITLTFSTPDQSATLLMLGGALAGLALFARFSRRAVSA